MKLCINCRHYVASPRSTEDQNFDVCMRFSKVSPVTGGPPTRKDYCDIERLLETCCGRDARFFEEKVAATEAA